MFCVGALFTNIYEKGHPWWGTNQGDYPEPCALGGPAGLGRVAVVTLRHCHWLCIWLLAPPTPPRLLHIQGAWIRAGPCTSRFATDPPPCLGWLCPLEFWMLGISENKLSFISELKWGLTLCLDCHIQKLLTSLSLEGLIKRGFL